MTADEYWAQRAELGAALRHLLWERRAIRSMFQGATGYMLVAGCTWLQGIWAEERRLCRQIRDLDSDYHDTRDGEVWNG